MKITIEKKRDYATASTEIYLDAEDKEIVKHLLIQSSNQVEYYDFFGGDWKGVLREGSKEYLIEIHLFDESTPPDITYEEAGKILNKLSIEVKKQIAFIKDVKKAQKIIEKLTFK